MISPLGKTVIRILIVDDVDFERDVMKIMLESVISVQKEIEFAENGWDCIKKLEAKQYDLVFLDNKLPGKSGITILEEIQRKGIKTNVIFLTGYGDEEIIVKAIRLGARDYISKDQLDAERLSKTVTSLLTDSGLPAGLDEKTLEQITGLLRDSYEITPQTISSLHLNDVQGTPKIMKGLEYLSERNQLEKKPLYTEVGCPDCNSIKKTSKLECPECGTNKMSKGEVLEHLTCGHIDFRHSFHGSSDSLTCPKCGKMLRQIGVDYQKIGVNFKCVHGHLFNAPIHRYRCADCDREYTLEESTLVTVYRYVSTSDGRLQLKLASQSQPPDQNQLPASE